MCIAKTLDGRLLCASECAYEIEEPYLQGAGYLKGALPQRITVGINSCLVGKNKDGIIVAFRGTQGASLLDWLQNAAIHLLNVQHIPGRIHAGFYEAVQRLYGQIKKIILNLLKDDYPFRKSSIYLTGHSKGGCLASLMAVLMKDDKELPDVKYVCSFAAARVGDAQFRDYFNRTIPQATYENYLDIIPFLPPGQETVEDMTSAMKSKIDK